MKIVDYKNSIINSLSTFPKDATVIMKNGVLESNQDKPLFLWIHHKNQPLFVFMMYTREVPARSQTPFLPLVFMGSNNAQISYRGNMFMHSYDRMWNVLITKDRLATLINRTNSSFPLFLFFTYVLLIITAPILFALFSMLSVIASSLLVYVLLYTFIPHIHIKKCIQAGMHGTHIPLFVTIFLFYLFPGATNILLIAVSLIFVFTLVSTFEMYSREITHLKGR